MSKWDKRFLEIAKDVSLWSKDPSTKIGAEVVGNQRQIISQGYNGFPRGVKDLPERYENRELKYKYVVHAEANAIFNALHNGSNLKDATIYIHGLPVCHECAKAVIQSGIKRVVINSKPSERWVDSVELAKQMFSEAGVEFNYIGDECD
jgi:dCMP deaminase